MEYETAISLLFIMYQHWWQFIFTISVWDPA